MKLKIVPLYHRCVVAPQEDVDLKSFTERTGIVIPEHTKEKPTQGIVVSVGGGRVLANGAICALRVHVGEMVVYNKYAGTEIRLDGKLFVIISEDEISCVLQAENPELNVPSPSV